MIRVNNALKDGKLKSRLILQVHDELLVEAHKDELKEVEQILRREMEQAAAFDVPLEVDMHTGNNWYEAK
ncbi:MAG: DNA polymerase, partial [Lachnospiraceae bacterium]|nr:DNA polymerase [Lachnospiraceae bacterium]